MDWDITDGYTCRFVLPLPLNWFKELMFVNFKLICVSFFLCRLLLKELYLLECLPSKKVNLLNYCRILGKCSQR